MSLLDLFYPPRAMRLDPRARVISPLGGDDGEPEAHRTKCAVAGWNRRATDEQLRGWIEEGRSPAQMAELAGVNLQSVYRMLARIGWSAARLKAIRK